MVTTRIPDFLGKDFNEMSYWFYEMSKRGLLFHPDDSPVEIVSIATNKQIFNSTECRKLERIIDDMFQAFGNQVYESAYPFFMERMRVQPDI